MKAKERGKRLKRSAGAALAACLIGFLLFAVGLILLCVRLFVAGGALAGCGGLLLLGGVLWGNSIICALKRNLVERARDVSSSAFLLYKDLFGVLEADGVRLCREEDPRGEVGRIGREHVRFWQYRSYRRPHDRGMSRVTVALPTSELPANGREADRGEEISYFDIDDDAVFGRAKELGYSAVRKSGGIGRPIRIERYGRIAVYDSGLYFEKLWTGDRRRFVPWEDVETVSRAEDELRFDCGYQQFAALYDERFWRDLEANYPEKILVTENDGPMSEEEPSKIQ